MTDTTEMIAKLREMLGRASIGGADAYEGDPCHSAGEWRAMHVLTHGVKIIEAGINPQEGAAILNVRSPHHAATVGKAGAAHYLQDAGSNVTEQNAPDHAFAEIKDSATYRIWDALLKKEPEIRHALSALERGVKPREPIKKRPGHVPAMQGEQNGTRAGAMR